MRPPGAKQAGALVFEQPAVAADILLVNEPRRGLYPCDQAPPVQQPFDQSSNHDSHDPWLRRGLGKELGTLLQSADGDPKKRLFQFLNLIGTRALRIQLGRVLEMTESSPDKFTYENKIAERFGGQIELELIVPTPSVIPPADSDEFANSPLLKAAAALAWQGNNK